MITEEHLKFEREKLVNLCTQQAIDTFWERSFADGEEATPPPTEILRLQACVADRLIPYDTVRQAMQAIAYLLVTFSSEDAELAVEALGMIMVHASVVCTIEQLAIEPVIDLALALHRSQEVETITAASTLATAIVSTRAAHRRGIEARRAIVDGLGIVIARGLDDVTIGHDVTINPLELFERIALEVFDGKLPRRESPIGAQVAVISNRPIPLDAGKRKAATTVLSAAVGVLTAEQGSGLPLDRMGDLEPGIPRPAGLAGLAELQAIMERELAHTTIRADAKEAEVDAHGYGKAQPAGAIIGLAAVDDPTSPLHGTLREFDLEQGCQSCTRLRARIELLTSGARKAWSDADDPRHTISVPSPEQALLTEHSRRAVPGLADDEVCPQCAAPMSRQSASHIWLCANGHEHTGMDLARLRAGHSSPGK